MTAASTDPRGAPPSSARGDGRPDPEQRVLRRALSAGTIVAAVLALGLAAGAVVAGGGGALGLAAVVTALTVGVLTSSGWLLLSLVLDLLAGRVPATRRLWWAIGLAAVGFVGPVFILGALSAALG